MKKTIGLITSIFLLCTQAAPAYAANQVSAIDIEAVIYEDGSMYVTQVWDTYFDEGTEIYIPLNAPEYLTISDLSVSDTKGEYQRLTNWDVDGSFEEKANQCGINTTDTGYEICFGISEYGKNRYAIEYRLQNVVGSYSDLDGAILGAGMLRLIDLGCLVPVTEERPGFCEPRSWSSSQAATTRYYGIISVNARKPAGNIFTPTTA